MAVRSAYVVVTIGFFVFGFRRKLLPEAPVFLRHAAYIVLPDRDWPAG
ncbi:MAG TPA: hypothetical protein VFG04_20195 [Planctomycetaceae bacterium]|nr:hypothetical protein [Planctomycetaceae bacterium]